MTRRTVHVFLIAWAILLGMAGLVAGGIVAVAAVAEWNEVAGGVLGVALICSAMAAVLTGIIRDVEKGRK